MGRSFGVQQEMENGAKFRILLDTLLLPLNPRTIKY